MHPLGSPFIELQSIDSTNNYALTRIRERMAEHGTAFFAHEQTAGKGQMGRQWISQKDSNIAMSLVLRPGSLQLSQQFWLSACIAVAVLNFLTRHAGNDMRIKWPNDLYWQDRKLGGILIENIVGASRAPAGPGLPSTWDWAVTGIGLNINQTSFPPELPNPVSLKQITGKTFDTVLLAKDLCGDINDGFGQLLRNGFDEIYKLYNENIYKRGATVKLKKNSAVFQTTIKAVSETGELVTHNGVFEERFAFGEISWLL